MEKHVQRRQALDQSPLDERPLISWNHPGNQIEWKNPLCAFLSTVNRECDALTQIRAVGKDPFSLKLIVL